MFSRQTIHVVEDVSQRGGDVKDINFPLIIISFLVSYQLRTPSLSKYQYLSLNDYVWDTSCDIEKQALPTVVTSSRIKEYRARIITGTDHTQERGAQVMSRVIIQLRDYFWLTSPKLSTFGKIRVSRRQYERCQGLL